MNETIPAINRRAVSTKERTPRRRAMLISINSTTFQLFLWRWEAARDDCKRREFSARVAKEKSTGVPLRVHIQGKETHYCLPRLFEGSTGPRTRPGLFSSGECREFCVIKHFIIAFPEGLRSNDNCGNGTKKYGIKICTNRVLFSSHNRSMRRSSWRGVIAPRIGGFAFEKK